jgi:hypothetical protein
MMKMMKRINYTMSAPTIIKRIGSAACPALALMMLMACGGGGGGGGGFGDLVAGGGIGGTGITIGAISGFGSVIVNDVRFNTEGTEVFVNGSEMGQGDPAVRRNLAKGMVVRVEARYPIDGEAVAERIVFTSNLNGPVQSITAIDSVVKIISILGQSVILDDQTQIENTASIAENIVLEVSGWPDAGGQIRASYVRKVSDTPDPNAEQMIKGNVTGRNEAQRWFRINQLMIDMSEIIDPVPAVGQQVIVHGELDENDILVARQIEIENELGVEDADNVEIEGIVSRVSSANDFILGSTAVQTDDATQFVGLTSHDIIPGSRLLVKGALAGGVLLADEVKAKDKVDIEGSVASVVMDDMVTGKIALRGLRPLVVSINSTTRIFGAASELSEIDEGQHVKILGYAAGMDDVVAGQVKVNKNPRPKVKLQGPIGDIIDSTILIFGVAIEVDEISEDGSVIPGDFLHQADRGDTVNVMGNLSGESVVWKEIELLNFDN